jgi:WD40 repeat protein
VYSAGSDGKIINWNITEKEKNANLLADMKGMIHHSIALSTDNQALAAGGDYPFLHLFNLQKTGSAAQKIKIPVQSVRFLAYTHNNRSIIFSDSASVYYYNFQSFTKIYTAATKINAIAVSSSDDQIAIGNNAGEIKLLEANGGITHIIQLKEAVTALAFSNNGKLLAIGDAKGIVRIWNAEKKDFDAVLTGHSARIINIKFSWNNQKLATASWDKTVRLWNTSQWNNLPIVLKDHSDWVWSITFSPDGNRILAGCRDSFIRLWPTNAKALADIICDKATRNMSKQEWEQFIAQLNDISYEKTCPSLAVGEGILNK